MIRSSKAIAAAALLFVMPTVASALGISIVNVSSTGASTSVLQNGDQITFDLRLENSGGVDVNGLDVVVTGFDTPGTTNVISSRLQLVDGSLATSAFSTVFVPAVGSLGGLANVRTGPTQVWAIDLINPQPVRTSLFAGASLTSSNGNASQDTGINGELIANGDVHFRVTYVLANLRGNSQNLVLNFGTDASLGHIAVGPTGEEIPFNNASYALTVIPEPGTALLMGLGLAALATRRR
jgi:uncharacterized repeat protein (TIGR01451 family)